MTLRAVGYGAGTKDWAIPNVLRVLLGDATGPRGLQAETLAVLETNIDDLNPEMYDYVMGRLFAAGALDVFLTPIQMKKNRPATLLCVLCRPARVDALSEILFAETSTLGIRRQDVLRTCLPREIRTVDTPYGPIRVKSGTLAWPGVKAAPEYEDCRRGRSARRAAARRVRSSHRLLNAQHARAAHWGTTESAPHVAAHGRHLSMRARAGLPLQTKRAPYSLRCSVQLATIWSGRRSGR